MTGAGLTPDACVPTAARSGGSDGNGIVPQSPFIHKLIRQGAATPCLISLFVVCTIFRTGPSAVFTIQLAAFVLGAILTVFKGRVVTAALIAVVVAAVQIASTGFSQLIALEAAAIDTVDFSVTDGFIAPIAQVLLRLCRHRLCRPGGFGDCR